MARSIACGSWSGIDAEGMRSLDHLVRDVLGDHVALQAFGAALPVLQKKGVTSPIVGASKAEHLTDAVAALSLKLTGDEIKMLEAPYVPHKVAGFS